MPVTTLRLLATCVLLATLNALAAAEPAITGFTIVIEEGKAAFRLVDHTLAFREGEHPEETLVLTGEQLARALVLVSHSALLARAPAAKPVGTAVMLELHIARGGKTEDRYFTAADTDQVEKTMRAQEEAAGNDPKALAELDLAGELFPYLFSLTAASVRRVPAGAGP